MVTSTTRPCPPRRRTVSVAARSPSAWLGCKSSGGWWLPRRKKRITASRLSPAARNSLFCADISGSPPSLSLPPIRKVVRRIVHAIGAEGPEVEGDFVGLGGGGGRIAHVIVGAPEWIHNVGLAAE